MEELCKKIILNINCLTRICGFCYKLRENPTDEIGENLIKEIDNCEEKFLNVKEEIIRTIKEIEKEQETKNNNLTSSESEIKGIKKKSGYLIREVNNE